MPETGKDTIRAILPDIDKLTWDSFQRSLDAYRDAAYWAGYRDAKDEILESHAKNKGP